MEWFDISRGLDNAGELLAAFEMIEYGSENIGRLPEPKPLHTEYPKGILTKSLNLISFCFSFLFVHGPNLILYFSLLQKEAS